MRFTTIKLRRLERDLLQLEVAREAAIERTRLSLIENGHVVPSAGELQRLAAALDVDPAELMAPGVAA
jgi:transcriptional regulator with XRE-family HTH domain